MSEKIVNALHNMKKVYVEKVSPNTLQEDYIQKQVKGFKSFSEQKLNPEKKDINNDKKIDSKDSYLHNRSRAIRKNMGIKPLVSENVFYSWRDTIDENLLTEIETQSNKKVVKEKKVNNYVGKKPVVVVGPETGTGFRYIDSEELYEGFVEDSIDAATNFLCEEGLTESDVSDLIEELGYEEFSEWVLELGYQSLNEWRRGAGGSKVRGGQMSKSGKHISTLKGGAKTAAIRATAEHKNRNKKDEPSDTGSNMTSALRSQSSSATKPKVKAKVKEAPKSTRPPGREKIIKGVQTAAKKAVSPENVRSTVKDALNTAARLALSAHSGHKKAMEIKKKGGSLVQQLGGGAGAAIGNYFKKGTKQFREWVENLLDEGYDLSEYTWDELYEDYELQEKAVSEQQQKLFGLALSVKRGETPKDEVSSDVLKIVNTMSETEIRKYASTPHDETLPKKLSEKVIHFIRENR